MGMYALAPLPVFSFLAAIDFQHTITLGSVILGVFISIATVVTLMYGAKYKSLAMQQEKVIETLEAGQTAWKETSERHELEKKGLMVLVNEQKQAIAKLEALPNLATILDKMAEKEKRQDEMAKERVDHAMTLLREMNEDLWRQHEAHARRREAEIMEVLRENNKFLQEVRKEVTDENT